MNLRICIWDTSFAHGSNQQDEVLRECIDRFETVVNIANESGQTLKAPLSWYDQEIERGQTLWEWPYQDVDGGRDEKVFIQKLMKQIEDIAQHEYDQLVNAIQTNTLSTPDALVGLYRPVKLEGDARLYIFEEPHWLDAHRYHLHRTSTLADFMTGMEKCFPRLHFSQEVPKSMHIFNKNFHDFRDEIIKHLTALDDHALDLFHKHSSDGDHVMMKRLESMGKIACSGQGDPNYEKKNLSFRFKNDSGHDEHVTCAPHTKLFHEGSDYRIYFDWGKSHIQQGRKLLVGHIGKHK